MGMLKFNAFGGEVPRKTKRDLGDSQARFAQNLRADSLEFRPLNTDFDPNWTVTGTSVGDVCRTLYRYPTNAAQPVGTALKMSLVRSPLAADTYDRVYGSMMYGETELAPIVLSTETSPGAVTNTPIPGASIRPMGVKYPTLPLAVSIATIDQTFRTPWEASGFRTSIIEDIKAIAVEAVEPVLWNPAFALGSMPAFRENSDLAGQGIWQRIYVNSTPNSATPTWNTMNGTPVENHLWTTQVTRQAAKMEGPNLVFYADFKAKVWTWKVKADVSAQTAKLAALVIPGTTDRIVSDAEITALWDLLRSVLPANPLDTTSAELKTLLTSYQSNFVTLVNYLDQGFTSPVTPEVGYQLVAQAVTALDSDVGGIITFYDRLLKQDFDGAVLHYFNSKLNANMPTGEAAFVESRYYTYTLVNDRGEESRPFQPEGAQEYPLIEVNQAQSVTITLPPNMLTSAGVGESDHITKWRIYRSATGTQSAGFLFVADVPVATTTYVDMRKTEALNEPLVTTSWNPPPVVNGANLKHLVSLPGGFMAGFIGNTVYFSEPFHPYAWPPEYSIPLQGDIVALGVFGVTLVVLTKRGPVYISGSAPGSLSPVVLESNEVCMSPRSVVPVSGGVVFASQNGLCMASQSGVQVLTNELWTKREWLALEPGEFICEEMNGVVYASHTGGNQVGALHIPSMKLVRMDLSVTAWYSDFHTGELFAAVPPLPGQQPKVIKLLDGTDVRTATWRSKRIVLEKETGFSWLRVEGEQSVAQPLTVNVYGYYIDNSGAEVEVKLLTERASGGNSAVLTDTRPSRIQVGRYKDFEVEITGKCRVTSVLLTSSTLELQKVN